MDDSRLAARIDAPVTHFERTPSTNDHARRLGRENAPHGAVVVADEQTAGRGRTGNAWAAPLGGVWMSVVLRPDVSAAHVGRLTFAAGVAAAETVEAFGADAALKWPNDCLIDGRKVCGVLTEAVVDDVPVAGKPVDEALPETDPADAALSFVVLGLGLNADLDPDDLDVDREVTTLRGAVGPVDPVEVATTLHARVLERASDVETTDGFAAVLDEWRERSVTLGERVHVERRTGDPVEGVAERVTERGALVVETATGRVEVAEGECTRLRSN